MVAKVSAVKGGQPRHQHRPPLPRQTRVRQRNHTKRLRHHRHATPARSTMSTARRTLPPPTIPPQNLGPQPRQPGEQQRPNITKTTLAEQHDAATSAPRVATRNHCHTRSSPATIVQCNNSSIPPENHNYKPMKRNEIRKTSHHAHHIKSTSNTRQTNLTRPQPNPIIYKAMIIGD